MMRLLIPLVLMLLGLGGGVGAGLLLSPPPEDEEELANPCGGVASAPPSEEEPGDEERAEAEGDPESHAQAAPGEEGVAGHDYVRLNNQFVVPLLTDGEVASLVMLSLSVEVPAGQEEAILLVEPKLRDLFLQVLFDHANTGGFDGLFTAASAMRDLRGSLLAAAQDEIGGMVTDVLILDLVRQDQ